MQSLKTAVFVYCILFLSFAHASNEEILCQKDLGETVSGSEEKPIPNLELLKFITGFIREEAREFGCSSIESTPGSIRETFNKMADRMNDSETIKEQFQTIDWRKSDLVTLINPGPRARLLLGFGLLRDHLNPAAKGRVLSMADAIETVKLYRALPPSPDEQPIDPNLSRKAPRVKVVRYSGDISPTLELNSVDDSVRDWSKYAKEQNISDKMVPLSFNRVTGAVWEGLIEIPADVLARVKFKNGINIEQIEAWIGRYEMTSLNALDGKAEYQFHGKELPSLKMNVVVRDSRLSLTDLRVE